MNIKQFSRQYRSKYPARVLELCQLYAKSTKSQLCSYIKINYPKLFVQLKKISGKLKDNQVSQELLFQFLFPDALCTCAECGSPTKFTAEFKRYREFCSNECRNSSSAIVQRRKDTTTERYGVDNIFKCEEFKSHIKEVMQSRYGVDNPSQAEHIKKKKRKTFTKHYGVDHYSKTEEYKQRFSENNPMYDIVSKARQKRTNLVRYGVSNPSYNEQVVEKIKQTHIDRYGCNAGALVSYATRFKFKEVTDKFGTTHLVQGYENRAIDYLSSLSFITSIVTGPTNIKRISYVNSRGKKSHYYPDILVTTKSGAEHLIEVKSSLTLFNKLRSGYYENAILKFAKATKYMKKRGGCFWVYYYADNGDFYRIKNPETSEQICEALGVNIL